MSQGFDARVHGRTLTVGVVGLGYVGLPLAVAFADAGFPVVGVDVSSGRVERLRAGESPILDVPSASLSPHVSSGRFCATTDYGDLSRADAVFVCVPTPFDRSKAPDLSFIVDAATRLSAVLRPGHLVILESTTYPGTTEEVLIPILERSGLRAGADFHVAFSPERIDPGSRTHTIANTPKVVGGIDAESTRRAGLVLEQIVRDGGVRRVSSPRVAELTKLLENTFRAVNIALVNELAMLCDRMGIDVWEVIDAARTKPYGFMAFYPGPGPGGHCLATGESIVVRDEQGGGPRTVDEIWARSASRSAVQTVNGVEVMDRPGIDVLAIGVDGPPRWEPAVQLFRRRFDGVLIHVRTIDGRETVVTDGHPMLVAGAAGIETRAARELQPGDLLPIVAELMEPPDDDPAVQVIPAIPNELVPKVRVAIRDRSWAPWRDILKARYGSARAHDWIRCGQIPLGVYRELSGSGADVPAPDRLVLWTGRGPARSSLDAVVRITPDVARAIGYYATEGCITTDSSQRVRFTFHAEEHEVVADLSATLRALGQRWSVSRDRSCANVHVKVSSQLFAVFVRDALGCGSSSYDSAVPEILLACGRRHRLALLAGLLRGDGSVDVRIGARECARAGRVATWQNNSANVGFWTTSVKLERQFSYLTQSLGIRTSIQRRRTQTGADFHLLGADIQPMLASLFADAKAARLTACLAAKRRTVRSRGTWSAAGQSVVAVASVEARRARTTVYSIETGDTHTFATGYGVFVHNCIPVDPYYLSWKARQYDFSTKFIEVAAETNQSMPFFTVDKMRRSLGARGKTLIGAKLLVLGAAFKKDVDDPRNSAAIRVMEILAAEGADVSYHDPYVGSVRLRTGLYGDENGGRDLRSVALTDEALRGADLVAILVGHGNVDYARVVSLAPFVFDAVNVTAGITDGRVVRL